MKFSPGVSSSRRKSRKVSIWPIAMTFASECIFIVQYVSSL